MTRVKIPPSQLLTKDEIERISREFTSPQKPDDVSETTIKEEIAEPKLTDEQVRMVTLDLEKAMAQTKIRTRAVLVPVNDIMKGERWYTDVSNTDDAIPMRYRSLSIGSGIGNNLNLLLYGKCCHVSTKHAIIFYDEVNFNFYCNIFSLLSLFLLIYNR